MTRRTLPIALLALSLAVGCSSNDDDSFGTTDTADDVSGDGTDGSDGTDGGDEDTTTGDDTEVPPTECDEGADGEKKQELQAAQPTIEGDARGAITVTVEWESLEDASQTCSVDLQFRDANGNGELDTYEDWRLTAAERAAALVALMSTDEKAALMAHPTLVDDPSSSEPGPNAEITAMIGAGMRFGRSTLLSESSTTRAKWANAIQSVAEGTTYGVPFVISMEPAHSDGNGRVRAKTFTRWPHEMGIAATGDVADVETYASYIGLEYRSIGVRMALGVPADLATDPRWFDSQFTFGENGDKVAASVAAFTKGLQGEQLTAESVAAVIGRFPGAGAAKGGLDARLEKGQFLTYPGDNMDAHLAAFATALDQGAMGVMMARGIPETGTWTALEGTVNGSTIEQVGAAFNQTLVTDVLRGHYAFGGLVVAPADILENAGVSLLGTPWGMESATASERAAKAIGAGVDQFIGLDDPAPITTALADGAVTDAQVDVAATHALELIFSLGLFEDPFVDPAQAPQFVGSDDAYRDSLDVTNRSMVLLINDEKPDGFLNGDGDGTQTADKGNAGNGTLRVLPAPPGVPYQTPGCSFMVLGDVDLDYVRTVAAGYGTLNNDATKIDGVEVSTHEERIPLTNYVFVRVASPFSQDVDAGDLMMSLPSLEWATSDNAAALDDVRFAREAIDADENAQTQLVVGIDAGRPAVVQELLDIGVDALYITWNVTDKVFLDVAFGIVDGTGVLPVGLPASDTDADSQLEDTPADGQHDTFVEGFGISTQMF